MRERAGEGYTARLTASTSCLSLQSLSQESGIGYMLASPLGEGVTRLIPQPNDHLILPS